MNFDFRVFLSAAFFLVLLHSASAQSDNWLLTTADFKTEQVALKEINSAGVKVVPADADQPQTITLDSFLDLQRQLPAVQSSAKFVLQLTGGDKLYGAPVSLTADALIWNSSAVGEISLPTFNLLGITRTTASSIVPGGREDVVGLANGDSVHGIIRARQRARRE